MLRAPGRRGRARERARQVQSLLYARAGLSRKLETLAPTLPIPRETALPDEEACKDPYVLDFLGLADPDSEKDLEAALIRKIERFLLERGTAAPTLMGLLDIKRRV